MRRAIYRPFTAQFAYFDNRLNDMLYQLPRLFPAPESSNTGFYLTGLGATKPFSHLDG